MAVEGGMGSGYRSSRRKGIAMALGVVDGEGVREARAETVYGLLQVVFTSGTAQIFADVNEPTITDRGFLVAVADDGMNVVLRNDAIDYFTWRADLPAETPNAV